MKKVEFYKEEIEPNSIWINNEYLVQLNLTGSCPLNCSFCYIKSNYNNIFLELRDIKKLWNNLRKCHRKLRLHYYVNITGGDVFLHPQWKKIAKFLKNEDSIKTVDPLLNRFWKEEHKELIYILKNKINYVQFNPTVVTEEDIETVRNIGKKVILKIPLIKKNKKKKL